MRFGKIEYMDWIKKFDLGESDNILDMGNSGMAMPFKSLDEVGIDMAKAPLSGDNFYGYSKLREGIAKRYNVKPEQVLTAQGTSMANFLLLSVKTQSGDTILVETPVYECLPAPAMSLGLNVVPITRKAADGWKIDIEETVSKALETKASVILITNPHNPTGIMESDDTIMELADGVGEHVLIIVDEVYREWIPEDRGKTAALKRPNIVVTSSLTKVWGFGHLRGGWAIAPEKLVDDCYHAYDHMGVLHPFLMDWISTELFNQDSFLDDLRQKHIDQIAEARSAVDNLVSLESVNLTDTIMPGFGAMAFWKFQGIGGDEIANLLLEKGNIFVIPGKFFGDKDYIRFAWTSGIDVVNKAAEKIDHILQNR